VRAEDKGFTVAAAWTFSNKAYSTNPRFVNDQKISWSQELGYLMKDEM
jgi:hypothetical protein